MQRFVARQNIQHFKDMLAAERDPARRVLLEAMIAEEEAKLLSDQDSKAPEPDTGGKSA